MRASLEDTRPLDVCIQPHTNSATYGMARGPKWTTLRRCTTTAQGGHRARGREKEGERERGDIERGGERKREREGERGRQSERGIERQSERERGEAHLSLLPVLSLRLFSVAARSSDGSRPRCILITFLRFVV